MRPTTTLIVNGIRNESDITQQVALVEQMVAQGVRRDRDRAGGLARARAGAAPRRSSRASSSSTSTTSWTRRRCSRRGIDVPFVGPDNRAGARAVGDVLAAKRLGKGEQVAILEGHPDGIQRAAAAARVRGRDARGRHDAWSSVQSAQWEQDEANAVAAALLREHPDLKAILASNDNMALGAAAAVRQAGRAGAGAGRRLRQHRRRAAAADGGPDRSPRPTSTATARGLRHRVRAQASSQGETTPAGSPDAGGCGHCAEMRRTRAEPVRCCAARPGQALRGAGADRRRPRLPPPARCTR